MSTNTVASVLPPASALPSHVLIVGDTAAAREAADGLESAGVNTVAASGGRDALRRVRDSAPDLIVVADGDTRDMTGSEFVRRLRTRSGRRSPVVVLGRPDEDVAPATGHDDPTAPAEDYLPADVDVAKLITHIRRVLHRPGAQPAVPARPAVSTQRMGEEIVRELQRAALAQRPGMLASVSVAELEQLRSRLGSRAEQAVAAAFDQLVALDAPVLEQHSERTGGAFLVLMPEVDPVAGRERLRRLSARLSAAVLDVDGEQVRITPVIGYSTFEGADSAQQLCDEADVALEDACLHLDLVPVEFSSSMIVAPAGPGAVGDRLLSLIERLAVPLQILFTLMVLLSLPFIVYVMASYTGFDLTSVTYPLVAATVAGTAAILWLESFQAVGAVEVPPEAAGPPPTATAIIAAYLPNEAATIVDTVVTVLAQDYPGDLQVILAYNSPQRLPVEATLVELAERDPRLLLLRVDASTSKAQNVNAALAHVRGRFVGIFDADHHPAPGSFSRAWRWLSRGHDVVQGHCVVRNGEASWVARLIAVEFEAIYAVSHPGRARLHGFGVFGGSNGYWRSDALRRIRMQRSMLTEDIDSSMRSLQDGFSIVSDPGLLSSELAPTTIEALWNQRMRWAQGWTQTARRHLWPALTSSRLRPRQKLGAAFLLGWTQVVPWVTIQVIPIIAFDVWRDGDLAGFGLVPLFVLLSVFTLTVGIAQTVFAYLLGDVSIRRHRGWFVLYALHSMLWFGEFKNLIARVAQLKELLGEHQWRVTPRTGSVPFTAVAVSAANPHRQHEAG